MPPSPPPAAAPSFSPGLFVLFITKAVQYSYEAEDSDLNTLTQLYGTTQYTLRSFQEFLPSRLPSHHADHGRTLVEECPTQPKRL